MRFSNVLTPLRTWLKNPAHVIVLLLSLIPLYVACMFALTYGWVRVPVTDQWTLGLFIATETKRNTLSPGDIFIGYLGHRTAVYTALTAFLARFTNWNIALGILVVPPLLVLKYALLLSVFRRLYPKRLILVLLPFSLMMFSLGQSDTWMHTVNIGWHLVVIFFLGALLTAVTQPPGWKPLLICALLTLGATYSMGTGLVLWVALPIAFWFSGYQKPSYYVAWGAACAIATLVYVNNLSNFPPAFAVVEESYTTINLTNPLRTAWLVFAYLSNAVIFFGKGASSAHVAVGFASAVCFAANLLYLRQKGIYTQRDLAVWIPMSAFAVGCGLLVSLGRAHVDPDIIMAPRFITASMLWWVALLVTAATAIPHLHRYRRRHLKYRLFVYSNLLVLGVGTALFFVTSFFFYTNVSLYHARPLRLIPGRADQALVDCTVSYPKTRQCRASFAEPELVYQLALYRLAIFAEFEPVTVLGDDYEAGTPIIIASPSPWLNLYIREWMLDGIPEQALFHIAPPPERIAIETFPRPLERIQADLSGPALTEIEAFTAGADAVWLISTPETSDYDPILLENLEAQGYVAAPYAIRQENYREASFNIYRLVLPSPDE